MIDVVECACVLRVVWGLSRGVFCFLQSEKSSEETDKGADRLGAQPSTLASVGNWAPSR